MPFRSASTTVRVVFACLSLLLGLGCSGEDSRPSGPTFDRRVARAALVTYADIAQAGYGDALAGAQDLVAAANELTTHPSAQTLSAARRAWVTARRPYSQTEAFRFSEGPIDQVEMLVNTWPIDETYLETGLAGGRQGVIEDVARYPDLSKTLLTTLNAREGETSISTGYHVIEFLLWGVDDNPTGAGSRSFLDYLQASDLSPRAQAVVARRGRYLELAAALLVEHLERVADAWSARGESSYRRTFLALAPQAALSLAVKSMWMLSGPELAGERLTVPYETKDPENEHSCFSDTTHADIVGDVLGLQNVCLGHYERLGGPPIRGTGLCTALDTLGGGLGQKLRAQIAASLRAARAIPPPFDQAILGGDETPGRHAVARTITSLEAQAHTLMEIGSRLGAAHSALALSP